MTEHEQQQPDVEVVDAPPTDDIDVEVVDTPPTDDIGAAMTLNRHDEPILSSAAMRMLERAGYIVPIASPIQLRQAASTLQRCYAAILDERDWLYTVSYKSTDRGREFQRQYLTTNHTEAIELADKFGGVVGAKPKKSGIVKLARALGIVCKPLLREERTVRGVIGYFVVYEAAHAGTGLKEEGVGWCDPSERNGKMSIHDMITTADTRAYGRAVLRLAGFGDVSADEVIAGASTSEELPTFVPEAVATKTMEPLPPLDSDNVLTASRIWAHALVSRNDRFAPDAQQNTLVARICRAEARRGSETSAKKLGTLGLYWGGAAQDSRGQAVFDVEPPPVRPEDIKAVDDAARSSDTQADKSNGATETNQAATKQDSVVDNTSANQEIRANHIPEPHPQAETITSGQAKKVSKLLLAAFNSDKDRCIAWLKTAAHVSTTVHLKTNQYDAVISELEQKKGA